MAGSDHSVSRARSPASFAALSALPEIAERRTLDRVRQRRQIEGTEGRDRTGATAGTRAASLRRNDSRAPSTRRGSGSGNFLEQRRQNAENGATSTVDSRSGLLLRRIRWTKRHNRWRFRYLSGDCARNGQDSQQN